MNYVIEVIQSILPWDVLVCMFYSGIIKTHYFAPDLGVVEI